MSFEIKKAVRKGAHVVVALSGESGCGKTYSAIRLARGLVGEQGKIGVIDTEQKRASLYADIYGGFDVIDLDPPYSPARYKEAIKTFKEAGYNAVVIDSMSHEWESEGGVIWMADNQKTSTGKPRMDMGKWAVPKAEHKALMTYILNSGMHVILCYRVKFPLIEVETEQGRKEYVRDNKPVIICEPNVEYDITVKLFLDKDTKFPKIQKCPEGIEYLFPNDKFISENAGDGIIKWLNNVQRDKDTIIKEGSAAKDLKAWAATLNESELYLARKYWKQIIPAPAAPKAKENTQEEDKITDVEL